jgi:hypothetical protein
MRTPRPSAAPGLLGLSLLALTLPQQLACKGCKSDQNLVDNQPTDTGTAGTTTEEWDRDWGQWLSMAAMADGSPAILSYDRTKGGVLLSIADTSKDPVEWTREEVDGYVNDTGRDVGNRGLYNSMAVAADGTIWAAYQDVDLLTMRWARRDPATGLWESNTADGGGEPDGDAGYFTSMALDSTSSPVVVHHDQVKGELRMSRWNGSAFSNSVLDAGEDTTDAEGATVDADVGEFASILISDGVEYVAYYDRAAGNLKLAWGIAGNMTIEVVDDGGGSRHVEGGGDVGQWPSMMVHEGKLWIAYHDVGNQDLLLASGTPGSWSIEAVDQGEYAGADSHIFLNGTQPAIVYFDGSENDMKLATRVGEGWQLEVLAGEDGAAGFHNAAVTTLGTTWAASYDYTKRTVWFDKL